MRAMAVRMRRLASRTLSRKIQVATKMKRHYGEGGQRQAPVHPQHDEDEHQRAGRRR